MSVIYDDECVRRGVVQFAVPNLAAVSLATVLGGLPAGFAPPTVIYRSIEQLPAGRVTFRICAPEATTAAVTSADADPAIPMGGMGGTPAGLPLSKDSLGLWSGTTATPVLPGTYRHNFRINGARVPDPRTTRFSEERTGINSILEVTGAAGEFQAFDPRVPHGAVNTIEYASTSLGVKRRAHVYTPPGYMRGSASYPVPYLVHGAGDSDDSWTSIGHARYILDNLIAAGKAKAMIVVMPFGHTPERANADMLSNTDFGDDLHKDLIPFVEANFRSQNDRTSRAMAGRSMGGAHTLQFGVTRSDRFAYVGVFSMGLIDTSQVKAYEAKHAPALRSGAAGRQAFRLVCYAIGKDDFLYRTVAPTRALLDKYDIKYVYHESGGGRTCMNWRDYLADFAPRPFR